MSYGCLCVREGADVQVTAAPPSSMLPSPFASFWLEARAAALIVASLWPITRRRGCLGGASTSAVRLEGGGSGARFDCARSSSMVVRFGGGSVGRRVIRGVGWWGVRARLSKW